MAEFWSGLLDGLAIPLKVAQFAADNFSWRALGQLFGFEVIFLSSCGVVWYGLCRYSRWNWKRKHRGDWL